MINRKRSSDEPLPARTALGNSQAPPGEQQQPPLQRSLSNRAGTGRAGPPAPLITAQRPRSTGKGRTISPAIDIKRGATLASAALHQLGGGVDHGLIAAAKPAPTLFEDLEGEVSGLTGRITAMTLAEGLDRQKMEKLLKARYPKLEIHTYQDVVHATPALDDPTSGDIFFFDEPLELSEIEIDEFTFHYSTIEPPHIQNDVITMNQSYAADHQVKLAISHALAQSTLLRCYEERLQCIVEMIKNLPEALADHGQVIISRKQVARLIGQVFLQRSAVNLLGVVLDVPEFFWSSPDHLQVLYKRVCEYLELHTRVEVINTRYGVLQEMLEMLRDHQNNQHSHRLEWIVIWLIAVALSIWRAFFRASGEAHKSVPLQRELVPTGICSSYWIRLPQEMRPEKPRAQINWVYIHGGGFVAGDALMYLGSFYAWLKHLAQAGVDCSILSVDYPLSPEHPFPCAVEAVAGTIEWLLQDSGESCDYIVGAAGGDKGIVSVSGIASVGGDSAGGNLAVTSLLRLRDSGKLAKLPLALTLISPAVDISNTSVFARRDPVSSHIDQEEPSAARECGSDSLLKVLRGFIADAQVAVATQCSTTAAGAAGASGWFDYLPGPSMVEEIHHYLHDPRLLTDPLVSPTYLMDFSGLSSRGMFITCVPVVYQEEQDQVHCWCCLGLPNLLRKSAVLTDYVAEVASRPAA
eukprot:gene10050-10206_t